MPGRILIAEDEELPRKLLTSIAIKLGYDAVAVSDGVELLTVAGTQTFDVIITDLMMKDLNGVSASEILKLQGNSTPVIALTAINPEEISHMQNSFIKVYHKPCDVNELFKYIETLIK